MSLTGHWNGDVRQQVKGHAALLDHLSVEELLLVRAEIDQRLPAVKLRDLDLETEAVVQYQRAKLMQEEILKEREEGAEAVPANQKAQIINSVAALLQQLNKVQDEKYTAERLKQIESTLVRVLNKWPPEMTNEFFEQYESALAH